MMRNKRTIVLGGVLLTLSSQSEGNIANAAATGTIVDDDGPTIAVGDLTEPEGNSGNHDALVPVTCAAATGLRRACAKASAARPLRHAPAARPRTRVRRTGS